MQIAKNTICLWFDNNAESATPNLPPGFTLQHFPTASSAQFSARQPTFRLAW